MRGFPPEHSGFSEASPVILTKNTSGLDDPVAGDDKGNRIIPYSRSYSPRGVWIVEMLGEVTIGGELPHRDLKQ